MSGKGNSGGRMLALIKILYSKTDEENPLNSSEIIELLLVFGYSCDRKTVYNDIDALIFSGYDIIKTAVPRRGYFLASREFEPAEISLLSDAVLAANFITPKKTRELTGKLKGFLSERQAADTVGRLYSDDRNKCTNEEIFYSVSSLHEAINKHKKVKLCYCRHTLQNGHNVCETKKEMVVSPYAMLWTNDHYYLICNYQKYDDLMHLRLDKIRKVEVIDENFRNFNEVSDYNDEFDVADYAKKTFNMFCGVTEDVKLQCSNELLEQVIDRFGDDIFIQTGDEDNFIFSSKVNVSRGLAVWILQYGGKMKVIKPQSLADSVLDEAKKIENLYK